MHHCLHWNAGDWLYGTFFSGYAKGPAVISLPGPSKDEKDKN
jgi:hypothetical protein